MYKYDTYPINCRLVVIKLLIIFLCFLMGGSQGLCGLDLTVPSTPANCMNMTKANDINYCCYISAIDVPAAYSSCILIPKSSPYTLLNVGNMFYSVNCTGIPNYYSVFPFEKDYKVCGTQSPTSEVDCSKFSTESDPCCLADTSSDFSKNPKCYVYPKNAGVVSTTNYSEMSSLKVDLYFRCSSQFIDFSLHKMIIFLLLIFLNI
jgi:hypothetical protein